MAELVFKTRAEYEEVIRLRGEISSLESQYARAKAEFKKGNLGVDVVDALELKLVSAKDKLLDLTQAHGKFLGTIGDEYGKLQGKIDECVQSQKGLDDSSDKVREKLQAQSDYIDKITAQQELAMRTLSHWAGVQITPQDISTKANRDALTSMAAEENAGNPNFDAAKFASVAEQAARIPDLIARTNAEMDKGGKILESNEAQYATLEGKINEHRAAMSQLAQDALKFSEIKLQFDNENTIKKAGEDANRIKETLEKSKAELAELLSQKAQAEAEPPQQSFFGRVKGALGFGGGEESETPAIDIEQVNRQIEEVEGRIKNLTEQLQTNFQGQTSLITQQIQQISNEYAQAQANMQAANDALLHANESGDSEAIIKAQENYNNAKVAVDGYKNKLQELTAQLNEVKNAMAGDAYAEAIASIDEMKAKTDEYLQKIAEQKELLASMKDAGSEAYAGIRSELESNLASAQASMQSYIAKQVTLYNDLKAELADLQNQKQALAQSGEIEQLEAVNQKIEETRGSIHNLALQLQESDATYKQFIQSNQEYGNVIGNNTSVIQAQTREEINHAGTLTEIIQKHEGLQEVMSHLPASVQSIIGKFSDMIKVTDNGLPNITASLQAVSKVGLGAIKTGLDIITAHPIIAMVAALIGAFMLLKKAAMMFFTESAEGQREWNKLTAFTGSLVKSVSDVIIAAFKVIYNQIKTLGMAVWDLWEVFTTTLFNATIWKGLGDAIVKLFSGDLSGAADSISSAFSKGWDEIKRTGKRALNDLADNAKNTATAFVDAYKTAFKEVTQLMSKARDAGETADKRNKLNKEQMEWRGEEAKMNTQIQALRTDIMGETDNKKKLAMIAQARELINQKTAKNVELAQREADLLDKDVNRHTSSLEAIKAQHEAQMNVYKAQKASAMEQRMLVRQAKTACKALAAEAKKAEKEKEQAAKKAAREAAQEAKRQEQEKAAAAKRAAEEAANAWIYEGSLIKQQRQAEDNMEKLNKLQIDLMQEGFEKQQALRDFQHRQEMVKLERQAEDARRAAVENAKKLWDEQEKAEESKYNNDAANKKAGKKYQVKTFNYEDPEVEAAGDRAYNEVMRQQGLMLRLQKIEDSKALKDMLKGYEDYTTKKFVLEKEFEEKLASLRAAREKAVKDGDTEIAAMLDGLIVATKEKFQKDNSKIDQDEFFKNNGLNRVFENAANMSSQALRDAQKIIRDRMQDGTVTNIEELDALGKKAKEIEDILFSREDAIYNKIGGGLMDMLRERARLTREVAKAEEDVQAAIERQNVLQSSVSSTKNAIAQELAPYASVNAETLTGADETEISKLFSAIPDDSVQLIKKLFETLRKQEKALKDSDTDLTTKRGIFEALKKRENETPDQKRNRLANTASYVSGQVGEMTASVDKLQQLGVFGQGDGDNEAVEKVKAAFNSAASAGEAFSKFMQGDFIGALNSALDSVISLFAVFGAGGNKAELQKEIDLLTESNAALAEVGQDLIQALNEANSLNARERYEKAKETIEAEKKNQERIAQDQIQMWETGAHSIGAMMADDYRDTLKKLGISSVESLFGMSKEDINKLKTQNGGQDWAEFESALRKAGASEHNGDAEGILNALNRAGELEEQLEKLEDSLRETITGISFDSMFNSFKSTLQDMKSSSKDFAAALEKDLNNAIINGIADKYQDKLRDWYKKWAKKQEEWNKMAEDGLTDEEARAIAAEREALQREKEEYIQAAVDERDAALESGALSETAQNKAGSSKGFANMSSEQADELNGRFTALQVSNQGILNAEMERNGQLSVLTTSVAEMYDACLKSNTMVQSILEIQANSYLELQEINTNTAQAAASFKQAMPYIEKLSLIAEKL